MKLQRVAFHPVAMRIAYIAVMKFGDGGVDNLRVGTDVRKIIEAVDDPDVEFGDPYVRVNKRLREELTKMGRPAPDPSLRVAIDVTTKQLEYLKKAVTKMADNVAPESATPILDILDALKTPEEIEYAPKT